MLTKDYIMRMIDTLIKVLEKLLLLKRSKNFGEALAEIDKVTKELFGLDRKFIGNLSDGQLLTMISTSETLIAPNCYLMGVLFKEEAEIYGLQNEIEKSTELYERSFNIFIEGLKNSGTAIEQGHIEKINEVAAVIENREITVNTEENLFFYYEFTGRFDKAEDLIYSLIEFDTKYIKDGIAFCERLLTKNDDVLNKGNLPRCEVEEGLSNLKSKKQ